MKKQTRIFVRIGVVFIALLFVASSATAMTFTGKKSPAMNFTGKKYPFSFMNETMISEGCSSAETELKYYMEEGLSTACDACGPSIWKSAIRLTQDEMSPYLDWTMTKVTVAFPAEQYCPSIDIKIYIFDKNTSTRPGNIIQITPTYTLNTPGVTAIPLPYPVELNSYEELWIAVEWYDVGYGPYAWLDTLTGPAVDQKGDFCYLNNAWGEIQTGGADYDGNWGIGAIIEGDDSTELSIRDIEGPVGLSANLSNIGTHGAVNVTWSLAVSGGLLNKVEVFETKSLPSLAAGSSMVITVGKFFGFGKIHIIVAAKADNAPEISVVKTAFLLGPFVVGIR